MIERHDLKDSGQEAQLFTRRTIVIWFFLLFLTLVLAARAFYLQVIHYDRYAALSDRNRILLQPIPPNRGLIMDRNGILLAANRASQNLGIMLERVSNLDETIAELRKLISISDRDVARFKERRKRQRRPFEAVHLRRNLSEKEIALVAVNLHNLAGVTIEADLVRYYPMADDLAHVLGYVSRINEAELKRIDGAAYRGTSSIGKIGLEQFYEKQLLGEVGYQKVEINARGRVLRVVERKAPKPGSNIRLHLDSQLQIAASEALGDRRGAIVVVDTKSGGILALVSKPSFNPNLFVTGIDTEAYSALRDSLDLPLFNRAIRGQYPPGSTIKPFVALAALDSGFTDWERSIFDPGYYQLTVGGRNYRDWKKYGHGKVNLDTAITQSCDVYFYEMAHRMGIDPVAELLDQFGFGKVSVRDSADALKGILPSSAWKRNALGESWFVGDSLNASIGQGFMLTTPLQLANATAVLANKGKWQQPKFVSTIEIADIPNQGLQDLEEKLPNYKPDSGKDIELADASNWDRMIAAMEQVVHGKRGTARGSSKGITYRMAGKTGTAQVVGIKQDDEYDSDELAERNRDHALFVGFAPVEDPQIAIAVIVENGEGGGSVAAPVARAVADAFLVGPLTEEQDI